MGLWRWPVSVAHAMEGFPGADETRSYNLHVAVYVLLECMCCSLYEIAVSPGQLILQFLDYLYPSCTNYKAHSSGRFIFLFLF